MGQNFPRGVLRKLALIAVAGCLAACSFIPRESFTAKEQATASIPGIPGVRFWLDGSKEELRAFIPASTLSSAISLTGNFDVLAVSGGAYDGAYGAGVIRGWTAAGGRPKFTIVTGVSAGALIAPLAFLGPAYDPELSEAFAGGDAEVLDDLQGIAALLGTGELRRSALEDLVSKFVNTQLLRAIAAEHARGRRLLIVTTNLDAQRGVVWDMGAIASQGAGARELFRDVLVASASVPGVFAPTFIEVTGPDGHRFREMHVDGGATTQVFVLPDVLLAAGMKVAGPKGAPAHVWVVINNHLSPGFEVVEAGFFPEISRSFSTLVKSSERQTLFATAELLGRERFYLTYIGDDFDRRIRGAGLKAGFNAPYMNALYRYGYERALSGNLWTHEVPLPGGTAMH